MQYKVAEFDGAKLDTAVAKALCDPRIIMWGDSPYIEDGTGAGHGSSGRGYRPSSDWQDGGPIIDQALIRIRPSGLLGPNGELMDGYIDDGERWFASIPDDADDWRFGSKTPLIAAMRAYVASKLGEEVDLP